MRERLWEKNYRKLNTSNIKQANPNERERFTDFLFFRCSGKKKVKVSDHHIDWLKWILFCLNKKDTLTHSLFSFVVVKKKKRVFYVGGEKNWIKFRKKSYFFFCFGTSFFHRSINTDTGLDWEKNINNSFSNSNNKKNWSKIRKQKSRIAIYLFCCCCCLIVFKSVFFLL